VQQNHVPQQGMSQQGMPQQSVSQQAMQAQPQQQNGMQQGGVMPQGNVQNGVNNVQTQPQNVGVPQGNQNAGQPNVGAPAGTAAPQTELSALQMLASLNGEATGPAMAAEVSPEAAVEAPAFSAQAVQANSAMPTNMVHVGTWRVGLPGNQNITLALNPDNSFQWNAIKDGKSSSFQGQYRMEGGRLTLVRSNDLQQMAGSWNGEGTNFTFKLDGATTSGLAFVRAE
jgi:hypothetical protein